jgi:VanZ family protein
VEYVPDRPSALAAASFWLPPLSMAAIIFLASGRPVPEFVPTFPFSDRLIHGGVFLTLGLLVARALIGSGAAAPPWAWAIAVVVSLAYGITDEAHQAFVPSRCADPVDVLFDGLGALLGTLAYRAGWRFRTGRAADRGTPGPDRR